MAKVYKKQAILLAMLIMTACGVLAGCALKSPREDKEERSSTATSQPTVTPDPTVTPEPTATPEATVTSEPIVTEIPVPTDAPAPTVSPAPTEKPEPAETPVPTKIPVSEIIVATDISYEEACTAYLVKTGTAVPKQNIVINETLGVGIAFVPLGNAEQLTHYNVYRSEDAGTTWTLAAKDFTHTEGDIARILIPSEAKDTVVCYFTLSEVTKQSSCIVSVDGGATWNMPPQASLPSRSLSDAEKDTSVVFGTYEQDGIAENGAEPLEWMVIKRSGDMAFLISKYGLETMQYRAEDDESKENPNSIDYMLNKVIYEKAFSEEEKAIITWVCILEDETILWGTDDRDDYLFQGMDSQITVPTAYAAQQGAWLTVNGKWSGITTAWLTTATGTTDGDYADFERCIVRRDGDIFFIGEEGVKDMVTIRPAIWVDLSKLKQ